MFFVKIFMAIPAHTDAIANIKSRISIIVPCLDVMCGKRSSSFFTFSTGVAAFFNYIVTPFSIFRPVAFSLNKSRTIAFIVPVQFSPVHFGKRIFAFFRTSPFSSIRFIKNSFPADLTSKTYSAFTIIGWFFADMRSRIFFFRFSASFNPNIPCCAFSFPCMTCPKTWNIKFFHPVSYRASTYFIIKRNCFWRFSFSSV